MVARGRSIATETDKLTRKVALAADQAVVVATPVDTGRARSNWIASLGVARSDVIDSYGPGAAQAAIDQAEGVIRSYEGGRGLSIHLTNNLPYIQRLNDGWSAQAPAHFIETAVTEAIAALTNGRVVVHLPG